MLDKNGATYGIKEHIVLLFQARHECVLGQIVLPGDILLVCSLHLLLEGLWVVWKQTMEVKIMSFFLSECRAFVEGWRIKKSTP